MTEKRAPFTFGGDEATIESLGIKEEEEKVVAQKIKKPITIPKTAPLHSQRETIDPHLERAKRAYKEGDYFTALIESAKALQLDPYNMEAEKLLRSSQRRFLVD